MIDSRYYRSSLHYTRQDSPGRVVGSWVVGGWLRKTENKAQAQHSWGWGLAELGNTLNIKDYAKAISITLQIYPQWELRYLWNFKPELMIVMNYYTNFGEDLFTQMRFWFINARTHISLHVHEFTPCVCGVCENFCDNSVLISRTEWVGPHSSPK